MDSAVYYGQLLAIVRNEQDPLLLTLALDQLQCLYQVLLDDAQPKRPGGPVPRSSCGPRWRPSRQQSPQAGVSLLRGAGVFCRRVQRLYDIWSGELAVDKLVLAEDRTELAQTLAIPCRQRSDDIIARQLAEHRQPRPAPPAGIYRPSWPRTRAVRDAFLHPCGSKKSPDGKLGEDAVANRTSLAPPAGGKIPAAQPGVTGGYRLPGIYSFPAIGCSPPWPTTIPRRRRRPMRQFLAQRPDYNPQLRMKILQAADGLFRASAIRARQESPTAQR